MQGIAFVQSRAIHVQSRTGMTVFSNPDRFNRRAGAGTGRKREGSNAEDAIVEIGHDYLPLVLLALGATAKD